ncbi:unnamed protein product [Amoebophrya sp. A25]|nr:unnamed protein product [Amoebophrya sp. A25]|eukprot:GSA25T00014314001.1
MNREKTRQHQTKEERPHSYFFDKVLEHLMQRSRTWRTDDAGGIIASASDYGQPEATESARREDPITSATAILKNNNSSKRTTSSMMKSRHLSGFTSRQLVNLLDAIAVANPTCLGNEFLSAALMEYVNQAAEQKLVQGRPSTQLARTLFALTLEHGDKMRGMPRSVLVLLEKYAGSVCQLRQPLFLHGGSSLLDDCEEEGAADAEMQNQGQDESTNLDQKQKSRMDAEPEDHGKQKSSSSPREEDDNLDIFGEDHMGFSDPTCTSSLGIDTYGAAPNASVSVTGARETRHQVDLFNAKEKSESKTLKDHGRKGSDRGPVRTSWKKQQEGAALRKIFEDCQVSDYRSDVRKGPFTLDIEIEASKIPDQLAETQAQGQRAVEVQIKVGIDLLSEAAYCPLSGQELGLVRFKQRILSRLKYPYVPIKRRRLFADVSSDAVYKSTLSTSRPGSPARARGKNRCEDASCTLGTKNDSVVREQSIIGEQQGGSWKANYVRRRIREAVKDVKKDQGFFDNYRASRRKNVRA